MGMSNKARELRKQRRTCVMKRQAGNVYKHEHRAQGIVNSLKAKNPNSTVKAFSCPICGKWHIGKPELEANG